MREQYQSFEFLGFELESVVAANVISLTLQIVIYDCVLRSCPDDSLRRRGIDDLPFTSSPKL